MKTSSDKNPIGSHLDNTTIERFLSQQKHLLVLLEQSKRVNLNKVKVPISITRWIQLKLGDAFRFVIYHNVRHIAR